MPALTISTGLLLIIIGVIGYTIGVSHDKASITALIPAFFGIVLFLCGFIAKSKESLRKHVMHVAVLVALIGFIASAGRLASKFSEITISAAYVAQIAMAIVCLFFVIAAVRSFIAARRNA